MKKYKFDFNKVRNFCFMLGASRQMKKKKKQASLGENIHSIYSIQRIGIIFLYH